MLPFEVPTCVPSHAPSGFQGAFFMSNVLFLFFPFVDQLFLFCARFFGKVSLFPHWSRLGSLLKFKGNVYPVGGSSQLCPLQLGVWVGPSCSGMSCRPTGQRHLEAAYCA